MTTLLNIFKDSIIELDKKFIADCNLNKELFPQHRIQSYCLFEKFQKPHLLRCLLYSDLMFTIRQAIATGGTVKASAWAYIKEIGFFLIKGLALLRPDYANIPAIQEGNISESTKIWYQDSEIFGNSCNITKLLCRDLIMFISTGNNNPELFIKYKKLCSEIYKTILNQNFENQKNTELVNDFENNLNNQFARKFYSALTSKILKAKISSKEELKQKFKILSIEPFQEIFIDCVTLYENMRSFEEVVPCKNTDQIPIGKKAVCINPLGIKIDIGKGIEEQTTDVVVPESRRYSECPNCAGRSAELCPNCNGSKCLKCENCSFGKLICEHCNGIGSVKLSIPGNNIVKCIHCSSSGKMHCKKCKGTSKVDCLICATGGVVPCETCAAYGNVEFRQIVQIKRSSISSSIRFSTIPKGCDIKIDKAIFSHYLNMTGTDLPNKVLNNFLDINLSSGFRDCISSHLLREKINSQLNGELVNQGLHIYHNFVYRLNYSLNGISCFSWWHPKVNDDSNTIIDVLQGILASAQKNFSNKKSFTAAKKVITAENLSKFDSKCLDEFSSYYKKLNLYRKFLVFVARMFVNPESIW